MRTSCLRSLLAITLCATVGAPMLAAEKAAPIRCQLAVVGGGSGGFGAALAAARLGVDVVLVERADCLGGNSVRAGVTCWEPGAGGTGIPFDLYRRIKQRPLAVGVYSHSRHMVWYDPQREPYRYPGGESVIDPTRRYLDSLQRHGSKGGLGSDPEFCRERWHGVVFEPDAMAETMLAMLRETGRCRVLLGRGMTGAKAQAGRVQSATLSDAATLEADFFVDATGDGALCEAVGCTMMSGQDARDRFGEAAAPEKATDRVNGVTLIYRAAPVATPQVEPLPADIPADCWWTRRFPVAQINHYPNGDLNVNMLPTMEGREFIRRDYREALDECRRRVRAHWHWMQENYAEFQKFRLRSMSPALGIRETRRVLGEYVLKQDDIAAGISRQTHADIICLADHIMDTHGSHARGIGELREPYGVPYRCLIPQGRRNLLIACRASSFSSLAASSCRLSRTMMQLGQAAGTAVALARELQVDLPDVPPERLREALRRQRVQLEHPLPDELRRALGEE